MCVTRTPKKDENEFYRREVFRDKGVEGQREQPPYSLTPFSLNICLKSAHIR